VNRLKIVSLALAIAAATLLPASSAVAARVGNPPVANFPQREDRTPVIDVYVTHCPAFNDGAGVVVFTPATQAHSPGQVNENCRG
jgi:hypothetical protein